MVVKANSTSGGKLDRNEGVLKVQAGKKIHTLVPGETIIAHQNVNHRFFNTSDKVTRFNVELRPASRGFEQSLQIGYGLARDGETKSNGFPKNRLALAWLFEISESNLPGWMSLFEFILRSQAKKAVSQGLDKQLIEKYVRF